MKIVQHWFKPSPTQIFRKMVRHISFKNWEKARLCIPLLSELNQEQATHILSKLLFLKNDDSLEKATFFKQLFQHQNKPYEFYDPKREGIWICANQNHPQFATTLFELGCPLETQHVFSVMSVWSGGKTETYMSALEASFLLNFYDMTQTLWNLSPKTMTDNLKSFLFKKNVPHSLIQSFGQGMAFDEKAQCIDFLCQSQPEYAQIFLKQLYEENIQKTTTHSFDNPELIQTWLIDIEQAHFNQTMPHPSKPILNKPRL